MEIKRVLCPVDFSESSSHALDHAVALAHWSHATVTALHVVPASVPYEGLETYPLIVRSAEELEQLRLKVVRFVEREAGGSGIDARIAEGDPAREILRQAEAMPAGLLVIGTHGRSGFERLLVGSVTEKILHHAPCPVLTVPPRTPDAVPIGLEAFRRILCAVDFSACSMSALDFASSLAQQAGGRLTLVHVIEPLPEFVPVTMRPFDPWEYAHAAQRKARGDLHEFVPDRVRAHAAITEVIAVGRPYEQILKVAREEASDLIVIGIHGRGAVDLLFFGSTTNQVVRRATCPVLTIKG